MYRLTVFVGLVLGQVLLTAGKPAYVDFEGNDSLFGTDTRKPRSVLSSDDNIKSKLGLLVDDGIRSSMDNRPHASGKSLESNFIDARADKHEEFQITAHGYGKNNIKLLHVKRDGPRHEIREYEIDVHLRLNSQRDYLEADNRDIVATDSQKNAVYLLAKQHGLKSPEDFGVLLCSHFLKQYRHVEEVNVRVEEYPWTRHQVNGVQHNHAFVFSPTATRFAQVTQLRSEPPRIRGGLKDLRVLKTTQSSLKGFFKDEYRTLPDEDDRLFSTVVAATWHYSVGDLDYDRAWNVVQECIFDKFAGPPGTGVYSPSVQNTLYLTEKCVLSKVKQIGSIEMQLPNKHYFAVDMSKFPKLVSAENKEVYQPIDKPYGIIYAKLDRKDLSS